MNVLPYLKAIVGFLVAFVGSLAAATDNSGITLHEWLAALLVGLGTFGGVWATPWLPSARTDKPGRHESR